MAEEQASAQGGGKSKIVIIIIAVVVLLIIGLVVAFFFLTKAPAEEQTTQSPQETSAPTTPNATSETATRYLRIGPVMQLDQFIVNLLSQGGRRYLKVRISLEMSVPEMENELNAKSAPIRDIIIEILTTKSPEDISTTRGKEKLKDEITQRLNEILIDGKIRNVFLTDMAIQ